MSRILTSKTFKVTPESMENGLTGPQIHSAMRVMEKLATAELVLPDAPCGEALCDLASNLQPRLRARLRTTFSSMFFQAPALYAGQQLALILSLRRHLSVAFCAGQQSYAEVATARVLMEWIREHWTICSALVDAQVVVLLCCHAFEEDTLQLLRTAQLRGLPIQVVTTPYFQWPPLGEDMNHTLARVPVSLDMKVGAAELKKQMGTVLERVEECMLSTREAKALL